MVAEAWEEQQRRAQQDVSEFAARELGSFRVRPLVLEGDPATAIVEKAHSERTDLVVMATHGYGRFRRFVLGSVTAKVLHDADCPVWTGAHLPAVPAGGQASQQASIQQVVCAVDLSAHSENVLDWAARLAGSFDARLFLVHAIPALVPAEADYYQEDWRAELSSEARDQLDRLQQSVGTKAEQLIVAGDVPHAICAQVEELGADILVIGRSSESGLLGRLRTNAYAIIRGAHCPVVSV
jgi:nucleotide-binding universal stress UspA family protein